MNTAQKFRRRTYNMKINNENYTRGNTTRKYSTENKTQKYNTEIQHKNYITKRGKTHMYKDRLNYLHQKLQMMVKVSKQQYVEIWPIPFQNDYPIND